MKFPVTKRFNKIELTFLITGFITLVFLVFFTIYSLTLLSTNLFKAFSTDTQKKPVNFDLEGYNKLGL